ncbi:thioester domain-containing protein [Leifsonia shinshuensis]|uniref:thioester domain-containing protein n=1 Tax=Leifsonia shinshuensis TaxID=150026 RepID=UPI001F5156C2|nr:thioester domain-containing protein [Leifsonia shinshuensis]MCI0156454.1 thioester domain-containing protein [Leifsonia shinshuensis]
MMSTLSRRAAALRRALVLGILASAVLVFSGVGAATASAIDAGTQNGSTVYVGKRQGYGGTGVFPVYAHPPADPANPGDPDLWAYCIEHNVSAKTDIEGVIDDPSGYLGANHFVDPAVQAKVLWVVAHSYPALSLADFGASVGVPSIARNDAIEATQYAIWRYTELTFDAPWAFETPDSGTAYWALLAGANASPVPTPVDTATVAISAPPAAPAAGTLVGPFVVTTNRTAARVTASPAATLTDAAGDPIDPSAVADGQSVYVDLRGTTAGGSTTLTATVSGAPVNGRIVSVPNLPGGTATAADHAQSVILVAGSTATTSAQTAVTWAGTSTGTGTAAGSGTAGAGAPELAATGSAPDGTALLAVLCLAGGLGVLGVRGLLGVRRRARA